MAFTEYIAVVRALAEGDGYLGALESKLESGHVVQKVGVRDDIGGRMSYRFLLARLGELTDHDVPAGGPAIESLLDRRAQRMATIDDEARRCCARFQGALGPQFTIAGSGVAGAALRGFAERAEAPRSLAIARLRWPQVRESGPLVEVLRLDIETTFRDELIRLAVGLGYAWSAAGEAVDGGLALLIDAMT